MNKKIKKLQKKVKKTLKKNNFIEEIANDFSDVMDKVSRKIKK